jgi:hypothetical protein
MTSLPKTHDRLRSVLGIAVSLTVFTGITLAYEYHRLVDLRHQVDRVAEAIASEGAETASLRDQLFQKGDPASFADIATTRGLVLEKNPTYLSLTGSWLSFVSR